jgi:uncharacterized phage infection (PIP) family protein YhgE
MNERKLNVIALLNKEIEALESEVNDLRSSLQDKENEVKDIRAAISMLQGASVKIPLSTKVIDTIQAIGRFSTSAQIAGYLHKKEEYLDIRALKRDVNSQLNRMKKKGAIAVDDTKNVQTFGLIDWTTPDGKVIDVFKAKLN